MLHHLAGLLRGFELLKVFDLILSFVGNNSLTMEYCACAGGSCQAIARQRHKHNPFLAEK
jgi:hypothetical protein